MGLDDSCNSALILGLSLAPSNNYFNHSVKKPSSLNLEPSLTLSLTGDSNSNKKSEEFSSPAAGGDQLCRQGSSLSGVSSFSTGRVKRERETKKEDEEEDEEGVSTRKKLRLNKEQSALLEQSFKQHSTLNPTQKQALSKQLNLTPRQVEVWFQNRRARTKLKQTETDCEFLKKCCETLTDENRRLQKEVQELKALKMTQIPFYKHMPAATLTMCPSCERIGAGTGETAVESAASKIPFPLAAAKPYFYNPFSNPSAAC